MSAQQAAPRERSDRYDIERTVILASEADLVQEPDQDHLFVENLPVEAQARSITERLGRASPSIKFRLRTLNQIYSPSIVRITGANRQTILGTIVTTDGLLITKASELDKVINCELSDGRRVIGEIIATHGRMDLALVKITTVPLTPIEFAEQLRQPSKGDILVTPGNLEDPIAIGLVSVELNDLQIKQPFNSKQVSIGITIANNAEARTIVVDQRYVQKLGVRVVRVEPRSVGEQANILVNDLICSINGKSISGVDSWNAALKLLSIGQRVSLEVIRNDKRFETTAQIKSSLRTIHDHWGGGEFSFRRFEFGTVIVHDSTIAPEECGGPIVDLEGSVVGINIARAMRAASFAIPTQSILAWIRQVDPNAKLVFKQNVTSQK